MKYYSPLLAAAAVASALVIPDEQVLSDVALQHKEKAGLPVEYPFSRLLRATFEDALNGPGDDGSQERDIFGISDPQSLEYDASTVDDANAWLAGAGIDDNDDDENNVDSNKKHKKRPHRPPHHQPPHHGPPTQTIYELIKCSKHTTKLAEYVDEDEKLVKLLNSTDATHTLFAPTDYAFSKIPKHAPKPSKKFVRDVLRYHMSPGVHSALQIFHTRTLPTLYNEASLGKDLPQRIVVRGGLGKLKLNFYSRIVASDIVSHNPLVEYIYTYLKLTTTAGNKRSYPRHKLHPPPTPKHPQSPQPPPHPLQHIRPRPNQNQPHHHPPTPFPAQPRPHNNRPAKLCLRKARPPNNRLPLFLSRQEIPPRPPQVPPLAQPDTILRRPVYGRRPDRAFRAPGLHPCGPADASLRALVVG